MADLAPCACVSADPATYWVCAQPLSYVAAAADCVARQAALVAVGSLAENTLVAQFARASVRTNVWIGGSRDDQFVWRWPDATPFWHGGRGGAAVDGAFVAWQPGEPNDSSSVAREPQRCLAMTLAGDDWDDRVCAQELAYVCER